VTVAEQANVIARSKVTEVASGGAPPSPPLAGREPRVGLPDPVALTVAVVAMLVVVIVAAVSLAPQEAATPVGQRDDTFARPFDYLLPADMKLRLSVKSERLHVLERTTGDEPEGISIWIVDDVLADPCRPDGPTSARQPGADGLIGHLRSLTGLELTDVARVTIDGRAATRLDAMVGGGRAACSFEGLRDLEGMSLWRDDVSPSKDWIFVPRDRPLPLTILDVDGETVVIEVWSYRDLDTWLPAANGIIASIRFFHAAGGSMRTSGIPSW
jgi:hypothetical protein